MTDEKLLKSYFNNEIEIFDSIASTNTYLKDEAKKGSKTKLVLAYSQTKGRGRLGKKFASNKGGLYFSFVSPMNNKNVGLITANVALACAKAIDEIYGIHTYIKWVNDLIYKGKKLGGILCESVFDGSNAAFCVTGIGINLVKSAIPSDLKAIASALFDESEPKKTAELIIRIYENANNTSYNIIEEYKKRLITLNKKVSFVLEGIVHEALALDVDENCALVVEENGKTKKLFFGEVSVS